MKIRAMAERSKSRRKEADSGRALGTGLDAKSKTTPGETVKGAGVTVMPGLGGLGFFKCRPRKTN